MIQLKHLLISAVTAGITFSASAATPPDSTLFQTWNHATQHWDTISMEIATFDPVSGLKLTSINKLYNNGVFELSSRTSNTYNSEGNPLYELYETYAGNAWLENYKNFYTYNSAGIHISTVSLGFNPSTNAFDTIFWDSTHVVMDANNRGVEYTDYSWDGFSRTMIPMTQKVALSFGSGNLPTSFVELTWNGTSFDSIARYSELAFKTSTRNDLNWTLLEDYVSESYNSGNWTMNRKAITSQENGKTINIDNFKWDNPGWELVSRDTFIFDQYGNRTHFLRNSKAMSGNWYLDAGLRDSIIYGSGDFIAQRIKKTYNNSGFWTNTVWETNYGQNATGIARPVYTPAAVYPNPASGNLHIDYQEGKTLEILDLNGRLLQSSRINDTHTTLDLNSFAKGVLLFRFVAEDGSSQVSRVIHQ